MTLQASFPVTMRVEHPTLSTNSSDYPGHPELKALAKTAEIQLGDLIPSEADELRVLQLLYSYRHLNGTNLDTMPPTDLITRRVRLKSGLKPHSIKAQIRWPPHKERWLRKLVQDGMKGGIYVRELQAPMVAYRPGMLGPF